jgi:hypothetical protein
MLYKMGILNAPSNLMDMPSHLICHLISCPVFPAALPIVASSLLMQHNVDIKP